MTAERPKASTEVDRCAEQVVSLGLEQRPRRRMQEQHPEGCQPPERISQREPRRTRPARGRLLHARMLLPGRRYSRLMYGRAPGHFAAWTLVES